MKNGKKVAAITAIAAALSVTAYNSFGGDDTPTEKETSKFLFLSDIHLDSFNQDTDYGGDTGMILWNAFLSKADSVIEEEKPNFIVYTGDLPSHIPCCFAVPDSVRVKHNKNISTILSGMRDLATKHKKTFMYLPGNNDGIAGDYASFADEKGDTPLSLIPENNNPYPALNINASGDKAPCMVSNPEPKLGYYSARPIEGLRIIALNTVIHSANYFSADGTDQNADAKKQMTWLSEQLKDAAKQGEKAYVTMHIPPGVNAYGYENGGDPTNWKQLPAPNDWNNQFLQIVADNQSTISGILYGHTHMDELRRFYDPSGQNITEVGISCPGVTPNHYNNPGFKIVTYHTKSKELMDFTTYHTLPSANTWGSSTYNFNTEFGYSSDNTMYENLSKDNIDSIHIKMNKIFMVKHGLPGYNVEPGIEVKTEK